jgi:hypothetical protein
MTNDLATLSSHLSQELRDIEHAVWTATEKDRQIRLAVASLFPRYSRYFDPSLTAQKITLVANTYFYALPPGIMEVSGIDLLDTSSLEMGVLDGQAWQVTGDPYSGTAKLRISPQIVDGVGGFVRVHGYGRYSVSNTGGLTLTTSTAASDIINTTAAHGLTTGDTVEFTALTGGTGLQVNIGYYVIAANLTTTAFQVSTLPGGPAVNFSSDITAGTVVHTFYIPDDYEPLVLARARAACYELMGADRAQFTRWQVKDQRTNVSMNELLALITEARSAARLIERQTPHVWRRPVPGRLGD